MTTLPVVHMITIKVAGNATQYSITHSLTLHSSLDEILTSDGLILLIIAHLAIFAPVSAKTYIIAREDAWHNTKIGVWGGKSLQKWPRCFRRLNDTTTADVLTHIGCYFGALYNIWRTTERATPRSCLLRIARIDDKFSEAS